MKIKNIPEEIKNEIKLDYLSNTSTKNLSIKYKLSLDVIYKLLKQFNIFVSHKNSSSSHQKYIVNHEYFNHIDTDNKAYILGLLYADGYNHRKSNNVSISLHEKDVDILYKINNELETNRPLLYLIKTKPNEGNQYRLTINSINISNKLESYGCGQAKTFNLKFPDFLKEELIPHFIRGYIDGDGYIGCNNKKTLSLTSTEDMCLKIKDIINKKFNIYCGIETRHPERNHNIRSLRIHGRKQIKVVLDWIYGNADLKLERKYQAYLKICDFKVKQRLKNPDGSYMSNDEKEKRYKEYNRNYQKNYQKRNVS